MAGLIKYLLLLAVLAVAWIFCLRRKRRAAPSAQTYSPAENMVRCAHCGLHVPQGQALHHTNRHYCCAAHRDLSHSQ